MSMLICATGKTLYESNFPTKFRFNRKYFSFWYSLV